MKKIIEASKCSGCHACVNICPKKAISMIEDKKGFKYPIIDQKKCVDCGLCIKTCPVINKNSSKSKEIKSYAAYNKNIDERLNSSSGGIFILLAKEIIKKNGVVFGASFESNFNVIHSFAENENDLKSFMGSKYTQSSIGSSYKKVKEFLDDDRYVLFTGTPCQIEGLLSYLKKDYDKLYTQDIICHGVPSPKAWRKYLDLQREKYKDHIEQIQFRNKDKGWSLFGMKIFFTKNIYSKSLDKDIFLQTFLKNICLRDSCYNCCFKKKYRLSDITLADYWGISNIHPEMNDDKGTSLVLINSIKGNELFDNIKNQIIYKETDLEKALKYNPALTISAKHCKNEVEFANNLDNIEFDKLYNKYVPRPNIFNRIVNACKKPIKKILYWLHYLQ